jgi:cytoskeletal protein RodZ
MSLVFNFEEMIATLTFISISCGLVWIFFKYLQRIRKKFDKLQTQSNVTYHQISNIVEESEPESEEESDEESHHSSQKKKKSRPSNSRKTKSYEEEEEGSRDDEKKKHASEENQVFKSMNGILDVNATNDSKIITLEQMHKLKVRVNSIPIIVTDQYTDCEFVHNGLMLQLKSSETECIVMLKDNNKKSHERHQNEAMVIFNFQNGRGYLSYNRISYSRLECFVEAVERVSQLLNQPPSIPNN